MAAPDGQGEQHGRRLTQAVGFAGASASMALEELCWLLRMAAHLVADPGEGETPLPPLTISESAVTAGQQGQPDSLAALSHALVANAALCAEPAAAHVISPRYGAPCCLEDILWGCPVSTALSVTSWPPKCACSYDHPSKCDTLPECYTILQSHIRCSAAGPCVLDV